MKQITTTSLDRKWHITFFPPQKGQNRLNKQIHGLHLSPIPLCSSERGEQTAEHVLTDCPECREVRQEYWLTEMTLNHRLYGAKRTLPATIERIIDTELAV